MSVIILVDVKLIAQRGYMPTPEDYTPEHLFRAIIDSTLQLYGVANKILWYDELKEAMFNNLYNEDTAASMAILAEDLREQRDKQEAG